MAKKSSASSARDNVSLNVEDVRVNADPATIATMMSALIHIPSYRKNFESDPIAHLKEVGIEVPDAVRSQITPQSIRRTIDELTEGGEEKTTAAIPGVAVAVRVGTSPGTRPGVSVGVRVATGTAALATPDIREKGGLRGRQQAQAVKREKRSRGREGGGSE